MKKLSAWELRFFPVRNKRRIPVAAAPGLPTVGLVLTSLRGSGARSHAPLVFPLDDLWAFAFGVRAACFTIGGPWCLELGRPTCRRCLGILRNHGLLPPLPFGPKPPIREAQLKKR